MEAIWLTPREFAREAGVSCRAVYRLIEGNKVHWRRAGGRLMVDRRSVRLIVREGGPTAPAPEEVGR